MICQRHYNEKIKIVWMLWSWLTFHSNVYRSWEMMGETLCLKRFLHLLRKIILMSLMWIIYINLLHDEKLKMWKIHIIILWSFFKFFFLLYTIIDMQLQELNSRFENSGLLLCVACLNSNDIFSTFNKEKLILVA